MSATHNSLVQNQIINGAPPSTVTTFTRCLLLDDQADGTTLGGDRTRVYESYSAAVDDTAELSAAALAALAVAFGQVPRPSSVMVGRVDTGGGEGWDDGLIACAVDNSQFFCVMSTSRTAAEIVEISTAVAAMARIYVAQVGDADWLTTGTPSAYSAILAHRKTRLVYHPTSTAWLDVAHAVQRTGFDPDVISAPWTAPVAGVAEYTLTDTQKGFALANGVGVMAPFGATPYYVYGGAAIDGTPFYEVVTDIWFEDRTNADMRAVKLAYDTRGDKFPLDVTGQAIYTGVLGAWLVKGTDAKHFADNPNNRVTPLDIQQSDYDTGLLRAQVVAAYLRGAERFETVSYLVRTLTAEV